MHFSKGQSSNCQRCNTGFQTPAQTRKCTGKPGQWQMQQIVKCMQINPVRQRTVQLYCAAGFNHDQPDGQNSTTLISMRTRTSLGTRLEGLDKVRNQSMVQDLSSSNTSQQSTGTNSSNMGSWCGGHTTPYLPTLQHPQQLRTAHQARNHRGSPQWPAMLQAVMQHHWQCLPVRCCGRDGCTLPLPHPL